jgi:hypothetical protein
MEIQSKEWKGKRDRENHMASLRTIEIEMIETRTFLSECRSSSFWWELRVLSLGVDDTCTRSFLSTQTHERGIFWIGMEWFLIGTIPNEMKGGRELLCEYAQKS